MRALPCALLLALLAGCGGDEDAAPDDRTAIDLPGDAMYPEGITAAADGSFYVGSMREGTVVRVPPGADSAEPFIAAGENGLVSTVGVHADDERGLLWACSSDPGASQLTGSAPPGLRWFDLANGEARGSADFPGGGFCNDIAIDGGGNVYVTDSFAPRVLRLPAGGDALEVWATDDAFSGEGFSLNGIEAQDEAIYTVKQSSGQLFRIAIGADGAAGAVEAVALERPLEGPDGLRAHGGALLVVEGGAGRLSRIDLASGEVAQLASGLDSPTTAAISGDRAWVVEGQLLHLFDSSSGAPQLPFEVVAVPID